MADWFDKSGGRECNVIWNGPLQAGWPPVVDWARACKTGTCSVVAPLPSPSLQRQVIFCDKHDTKMKRTHLLDLPRIAIFFIFLNTLDKLYHHVLCPWSLKVSGWGGILWNIFQGNRKFYLTYWYMSVIIENQNSLLCLCKNIQSC